jgi:hypothetical protein
MHRLSPDPVGGQGFLASAIVCFGMAGILYYGISQQTGPSPRELWAAFGFVALFGLALVVAILKKALRRGSSRSPVVEVDAQPWRPGLRHQVRVVVPDPKSLIELDVSLQALSWERVPRSSRRRKHQVPVHTTTLLNLSGDALEAARSAGTIDRIVGVAVPSEAASQQWLWGINVRGTTKAFTPFQLKLMDKMLKAQIPKDVPEAQRELIYGELTKNVGRGTPAWEDWFRVEIDRPGA